jgi:hypothetical protein
MAYGILVENESGFVQIDGLDKNLQIVATGTTANFPFGSFLTTSLPSGLDDSMVIFFAPNSTAGSGYGNTIPVYAEIDYSANTFTIGRTLSFSFYQGSFNYVICVSNQSEPTSGYGFNTYTSSSDLAFSSEYKQMKNLAHHTYGIGAYNTSQAETVNFTEANPAWDSGTNPQDYYVMVNATGRTGAVMISSNSYTFTASFVSWTWFSSTTQTPNGVRTGSHYGICAPIRSGIIASVASQDTRTQIIARRP